MTRNETAAWEDRRLPYGAGSRLEYTLPDGTVLGHVERIPRVDGRPCHEATVRRGAEWGGGIRFAGEREAMRHVETEAR